MSPLKGCPEYKNIFNYKMAKLNRGRGRDFCSSAEGICFRNAFIIEKTV
jgi:hypothetical protein